VTVGGGNKVERHIQNKTLLIGNKNQKTNQSRQLHKVASFFWATLHMPCYTANAKYTIKPDYKDMQLALNNLRNYCMSLVDVIIVSGITYEL